MATIQQVSDYVIFRLKGEGANSLDTLKHQKLLYYIQAWSLAFTGREMYDANFQAWLHGPVNREIYNLYKDSKYLYSEMHINDITDMLNINRLTDDEKLHIDSILEAYAPFSSTQLEHMTHNEEPWIEARVGYDSYARCEEVIKPQTMQKYYAARLQ
jgi:uncharacterized phage-associated protein